MSAAKDYQDKKEAFAQARIGWSRIKMATNEEIGAGAALDAAALALMVALVDEPGWRTTDDLLERGQALLKGEELEGKPT